jgi:hypothetical protein
VLKPRCSRSGIVFVVLGLVTLVPALYASAQDTKSKIRSVPSADLTRCEWGGEGCTLSSRDVKKEIGRRIQALSTPDLIDLLTYKRPFEYDDYHIQGELVRRKPIDPLIQAYRKNSNNDLDGLASREKVSEVLYRIHGRRVETFMRSILTDIEEDWYPKNYLARLGDRQAMAELSRRCGYSIASYIWADSLEQFGKFRYRPAIPCLVKWVWSPSNPADSAYKSLLRLYPDAPRDLSPEAAHEYFGKRYAQEKASQSKAPSSNPEP